MQLTVLGRYSPFPPAGGAQSGYLIRYGDTALLLDAGNGVVARLQSHLAVERLTAVVISHLHEDHIADVHCLRFAQLAAQMTGRTTAKLSVWAPSEPAEKHVWLEGGEQWQDLQTYDPSLPLILGELKVHFIRTEHPVPCYAMRISPAAADGPVLFYSADTAWSPLVNSAARGADLLLIEASLTEEYADRRHFGHLTAAEAGAVARETGAGRCLLTHLWPEANPAQLLAESRVHCPHVELAQEGQTYTVGS